MILRVLLTIIGFALANFNISRFNMTQNGFPKVIWSYWSQDINQAPFFVQLCMMNIDNEAIKNEWSHVLLSNENLHEYLDPQEVDQYVGMSNRTNIQVKSDIIRLLLTMRYGGLWLDATSYLLTNLSWVQNPNHQYIHNKLSSHPDIIIAAFGPNIQQQRSYKYGEQKIYFPLYQNWMILSKPNNEYLKDCLKIYIQAYEKSKKKLDQQLIQQRIYLPGKARSSYFLVSDYIQNIAIYRKQNKLQKQNSTLLAMEYYRIWNLVAEQSVFKIFHDYTQQMNPMWSDLSTFTKQQMSYPLQPPFFRKYVGKYHPTYTNILQNYIDYNCWGIDWIIQQGSQIDEKLLSNARGSILIKDIQQLNNNLDNRQYCSNKIKQKSMISMAIKIYFWLFIIMMIMITWYCLGFNYKRRQFNQKIKIQEVVISEIMTENNKKQMEQ